jgi:hypothetical protein
VHLFRGRIFGLGDGTKRFHHVVLEERVALATGHRGDGLKREFRVGFIRHGVSFLLYLRFLPGESQRAVHADKFSVRNTAHEIKNDRRFPQSGWLAV